MDSATNVEKVHFLITLCLLFFLPSLHVITVLSLPFSLLPNFVLYGQGFKLEQKLTNQLDCKF